LMLTAFGFGTVPIKRLQYDTHNYRSVSAWSSVAMLHFQ
jgi:hypothetical protein